MREPVFLIPEPFSLGSASGFSAFGYVERTWSFVRFLPSW